MKKNVFDLIFFAGHILRMIPRANLYDYYIDGPILIEQKKTVEHVVSPSVVSE